MNELREEYAQKVEAIRVRYRKAKDLYTKSEAYSEQHKAEKIAEAWLTAENAMYTLRKEYPAAVDAHFSTLASRAFKCTGDQSAYLNAVNAADMMDSEGRQRALKNALDINAFDHARAIGRAAWNSMDFKTVSALASIEDARGITEPVNDLLASAQQNSDTDDRNFRMFAFTLTR